MHGRQLQMTVSTIDQLTAAILDSNIATIVIQSGTYTFSTSSGCGTGGLCTCSDCMNSPSPYSMSALNIDRNVTIKAAQDGTVVLDAQGWRVIYVASGATVTLTGLSITGGNGYGGVCQST